MLIEVLAPGDLIAHRNFVDAFAGGDLVAGAENLIRSSMGYVHFAFNHRDSRPFETAVNGEDSAGHRNTAVLCSNIKMPRLALCGLHNDAAALQMNGGVAARQRDEPLSALIHLDQRSIAQAHHRARSAGST